MEQTQVATQPQSGNLLAGWISRQTVYFGRAQAILNQRERIKRKTLETRRLQHRKFAA